MPEADEKDSPDLGVTALILVMVLLRLVLRGTGGGAVPGVVSREGCSIVAPRNLFFGAMGLGWVGVLARLMVATEPRALLVGALTSVAWKVSVLRISTNAP
jgi:hypothetical protein